MKNLLKLTCVAALFMPSVSHAQDKQQNDSKVFGTGAVISPNGGYFGSGLQFEGGTTGSKVTLGLGFRDDKRDRNGEQVKSSRNKFGLNFSTALDEKAKQTNLITDNGLPGEYTAGVTFSRVFSNYVTDVQIEKAELQIFINAVAACKKAGVKKATECDKVGNTAELRKPENAPYISEEERTFLQENVTRKSFFESDLYLYGVSANFGRQSFGLRDLESFEESTISKTPYSLSGYVGISPGGSESAKRSPVTYFAGVKYERSFEAADSQTLCNAAMDDMPIECFSSAFTAPSKKTEKTVYGNVRTKKDFTFGDEVFSIGAEVILAYDFESKVTAVDIPIYLIADKDGKLNSGIRLSWEDDDDPDIGLGFFVGRKFDLFR